MLFKRRERCAVLFCQSNHKPSSIMRMAKKEMVGFRRPLMHISSASEQPWFGHAAAALGGSATGGSAGLAAQAALG
jgi:hypothetical protein